MKSPYSTAKLVLPAVLSMLALAGALLVATPADAASAARPAQAPVAEATPSPVVSPPFVDDERRHVVQNVRTNGYLIHEGYSAPGCVNCYVLAWTAGVTPPANEWFFEEGQVRGGYLWFRMRNAKSNLCAAPGRIVDGLPSVVSKDCSSTNEFLWRAEPDREGDWRTVKFVSSITRNAIRPVYGAGPNEFVVLADDGYSPNYYWSVSR
ncbi:hypothetical protein ABT340_20210 [Streptosporangium sp. NPDC000239]|uniref:hypothetical protein n=1 Tax=Streptosporangium sp. NPDC000239 TaxID=3154248 RepID=UPI00331748C5